MHILIHIIVLITIIIASIWDIRHRTIPNPLVYITAASALLVHSIYDGLPGFLFSTFGLITGLSLLIVFYLLGMVGAGDVKLLASLGAWLGTSEILVVFFLTSFLGALLAVFYLLKAYCLQWKNKIKVKPETLPYGLAISGGAFVIILMQYLSRITL